MSLNGSSAISLHLKNSATLYRIVSFSAALLVIFSLISCEGGVYSNDNLTLLYSIDYDSVAINCAEGKEYQIVADFSGINKVILTYEHKAQADEYFTYSHFTIDTSAFNYLRLIEKNENFVTYYDTLDIISKVTGRRVSRGFNFGRYSDTLNYIVIRNLKVYKYM